MTSASTESGYYFITQGSEAEIGLDIEHMHLQQPQIQVQPQKQQLHLQHLHSPPNLSTETAPAPSLQHPFSHLYQTSTTSPSSTPAPGFAATSFVSASGMGASEIGAFYSVHPEQLLQDIPQSDIKQEQQYGEHQQMHSPYPMESNSYPISHTAQFSTSAFAISEEPTGADLTATALHSLIAQGDPLDIPSTSTTTDILNNNQSGRLANRRSLFAIAPLDPSPSSPPSSTSSSSSSASSSTVSSPISSNFDETMLVMMAPPSVIACANCKRSHIKCDSGRPCQNCLKHPSKAMTCRDAVPKPRGRPKGGSKAAAEAILMAKLQQQQQQQQQQQLQQHPPLPGLVPRPRVMSLPQQPMPHVPLHTPQQQPHHQRRQHSFSAEPLHVVSRSSPTSPAAIEHRAIRSNRRPSLPTWHHPYVLTSPTPTTATNAPAALCSYAPMVPAGGQLFFSCGETPEAYNSNMMRTFSRPLSMSSIPSTSSSSMTSTPVLTSMTTQDIYHPLTSPPSITMGFPQGLEGIQFIHQQQQQQPQQPIHGNGLINSHSASSYIPNFYSNETHTSERTDVVDNGLRLGIHNNNNNNDLNGQERVDQGQQQNMTALLENQRQVEAELQRLQHHQHLLLQQEHQKQQALVRYSMQQRKQQQQHQQKLQLVKQQQ